MLKNNSMISSGNINIINKKQCQIITPHKPNILPEYNLNENGVINLYANIDTHYISDVDVNVFGIISDNSSISVDGEYQETIIAKKCINHMGDMKLKLKPITTADEIIEYMDGEDFSTLLSKAQSDRGNAKLIKPCKLYFNRRNGKKSFIYNSNERNIIENEDEILDELKRVLFNNYMCFRDLIAYGETLCNATTTLLSYTITNERLLQSLQDNFDCPHNFSNIYKQIATLPTGDGGDGVVNPFTVYDKIIPKSTRYSVVSKIASVTECRDEYCKVCNINIDSVSVDTIDYNFIYELCINDIIISYVIDNEDTHECSEYCECHIEEGVFTDDCKCYFDNHKYNEECEAGYSEANCNENCKCPKHHPVHKCECHNTLMHVQFTYDEEYDDKFADGPVKREITNINNSSETQLPRNSMEIIKNRLRKMKKRKQTRSELIYELSNPVEISDYLCKYCHYCGCLSYIIILINYFVEAAIMLEKEYILDGDQEEAAYFHQVVKELTEHYKLPERKLCDKCSKHGFLYNSVYYYPYGDGETLISLLYDNINGLYFTLPIVEESEGKYKLSTEYPTDVYHHSDYQILNHSSDLLSIDVEEGKENEYVLKFPINKYFEIEPKLNTKLPTNMSTPTISLVCTTNIDDNTEKTIADAITEQLKTILGYITISNIKVLLQDDISFDYYSECHNKCTIASECDIIENVHIEYTIGTDTGMPSEMNLEIDRIKNTLEYANGGGDDSYIEEITIVIYLPKYLDGFKVKIGTEDGENRYLALYSTKNITIPCDACVRMTRGEEYDFETSEITIFEHKNAEDKDIVLYKIENIGEFIESLPEREVSISDIFNFARVDRVVRNIDNVHNIPNALMFEPKNKDTIKMKTMRSKENDISHDPMLVYMEKEILDKCDKENDLIPVFVNSSLFKVVN